MMSAQPFNPVEFRRIGGNDAWARYADRLTWGRGQTLAVLDDGCDLSAPQWTAPLPWGAPKVVAGYDSVDCRDDPSPVPPGYHGTSVAYASSINFDGTLGVAYNDQVIHLRAVTIVHLPEYQTESIARGLQWVIDHREQYNITAVNLGPLDDIPHVEPVTQTPAVDEALASLRGLGVWVSAPCGNNEHTNGISWPACQADCFAIGATRPDEDVAWKDRFANTDILVPAQATSTSNSLIVGCAMVLREAIDKAGFNWQAEGETLGGAMMAIFKKTGADVHDGATGLDFKRLDLLAALDYVFSAAP